MFDNRDHPERREDEVFITNCWNDSAHQYLDDPRDDFDSIGWETKRAGCVAYDIHGNILVDCYPAFAQISELVAASVDVTRMLPS